MSLFNSIENNFLKKKSLIHLSCSAARWLLQVCEAEQFGLYYFHAAMAELTPTVVNFIFEGHKGGLRKMADETNPLVARWFRREYRTCANIVATDYFLGADIVSVAIQSNIDRSKLYRTS